MSTDLLRNALGTLRLDGAIFFRGEFTEDFAVVSRPNDVAGTIHEGAERLILFHIVADGTCWVSSGDGVRHLARRGDVIVLPYGDEHTIAGEATVESVPVLALIEPPPWSEVPVARHGGGGPGVDLICGYLVCDDPLFDPAIRVFPPAFVVRLPEGTAAGWVQASIEYSLDAGLTETDGDGPPSAGIVETRLPELVLTEVLRLHLTNAPAADQGWLAALHDPVVAPALALLHQAPERKWTVAELASETAVSRSVLDERFRQVLGLSPIRYLTEWRMHLAEELLVTTDLGVAVIARRVGYDSEEAFSRAFKRARGTSPSHWRAAR